MAPHWILLSSLITIASANLLEANLDETRFNQLYSELKPERQSWQTIPWHANLISAQHQAVKEDKPLFVWAMDGHPLGCT